MKYHFLLFFLLTTIVACDTGKDDLIDDEANAATKTPELVEQYGFILNDFDVVRDTIRSGDTFGDILDAHDVTQDKIFEVATKFQDSFDVRRIVVGKPYVLLKAKDSANTTQAFIYEKNRTEYAVVDFRNEISSYTGTKPVSLIEKTASGVITSSLSQTLSDQNLSPYFTDRLSNIYAWTVDFFHLQEGDRFKVIYTEKYINDTIPAGLQEIKAAVFEHKGKPIYAFHFEKDSVEGKKDYYDENAETLRRAFLKSPIQFNYRISSRYNLTRRIKYYGYKVRPHKGTDFAAPIGTPILATADGTVTKSERRGGNGNYVKIRHNATYDTQYLHMQRRNVRVGDYVQQGDVIGWIGMTGNTGGPHVCYRFWKNGKQVDPFLQDLPMSEPLAENLQDNYFTFITPVKERLDCIPY